MPEPTADGFDTLYSARYGQTFHSRHGAGAEARLVFLENTGIAARLDAGRPARVLEVGFGTGLNFLMSAQHAIAHGAALDYVALERDVLPADALAALNHGAMLGAEALQELLVAWRCGLPESVVPGTYRLDLGERVALTLVVGDATEAALTGSFDAVYLDAFSPAANPGLWTPAFLRRLHGALRPGGRLGTYSAKGSVRRALAEAGFAVEKRPGPPGKREVVVAVR